MMVPGSNQRTLLGWLAHRARALYDEISLFRYHAARPFANRAFRQLCREDLTSRPTAPFVICEGLWDHPYHWLRLAIFAPLLAKNLDSRLLGLYEVTTSRRVIDSLNSLPLSETICINSVPNPRHFAQAESLLKDVKSPRDIINLALPFGYPGHLFYDGVLKSELMGTTDASLPRLAGYLAQTLVYLEEYAALFDRSRISAVIASHPVNFRFSTLVFIGLSRGIPAYILNYANEHITVRRLMTSGEMVQGAFERPLLEHVRNLPDGKKERLVTIGRDYLKAMRKGSRGEGATVAVYDGTDDQSADRIALLKSMGADPAKPTIVIMTNCWPDFPNVYFPGWYTDYVDWFRKTFAIISDCPDYNWLIRAHPAEFKYGNKTQLSDLIPDPLPSGVLIWPSSVSGNLVATVADLVVTATGTAGIEYPASGTPALIARETPYRHWGFVNFSPTREGYADLLREARAIPRPSKEQQELALMYLAITLCSAPQMDGSYRFPWGSMSYKLWISIADFIRQNRRELNFESAMLSRWLESEIDSYNVFKSVNFDLWGSPPD